MFPQMLNLDYLHLILEKHFKEIVIDCSIVQLEVD